MILEQKRLCLVFSRKGSLFQSTGFAEARGGLWGSAGKVYLGMVYLINGNSAKYKKQPKALLKSGQCCCYLCGIVPVVCLHSGAKHCMDFKSAIRVSRHWMCPRPTDKIGCKNSTRLDVDRYSLTLLARFASQLEQCLCKASTACWAMPQWSSELLLHLCGVEG